MRVRGGKALAGAMLLAGCSATQSSGVLPLDPGNYGLTVTSRNLGTAAEMALSEATGFCTRQGEQTQLLRTQINPGDYQLVFRCVGAVVPARQAGRPGAPATRGASFDYGGPAPENAPILRGQAFAPVAEVPRTAVAPAAAGYAGLGPSGLPLQPPTLGALMAAARQQARPVPEVPPPRRDWFSRVFGADDAPNAAVPDPSRNNGFASQPGFGPSPLPPGMQPFRIPEPVRAAPGQAVAPVPQPLQAPMPVAVAPPPPPLQAPEPLAPPPPPLQAPPPLALETPPVQVPAPLQSPLARQAAPRGNEPVFAPLPASALAPVAAPRGFESLPPVTGLPGGPPQRALTPLPPIGEPPQRAFVTDVPARLPPPATGQAAPEAAGAGGASVTPPSGFWDLRRN